MAFPTQSVFFLFFQLFHGLFVAIISVVRCFEDADIIHVEGTVDPVRDIDIINIELTLADMAQVYICYVRRQARFFISS